MILATIILAFTLLLVGYGIESALNRVAAAIILTIPEDKKENQQK